MGQPQVGEGAAEADWCAHDWMQGRWRSAKQEAEQDQTGSEGRIGSKQIRHGGDRRRAAELRKRRTLARSAPSPATERDVEMTEAVAGSLAARSVSSPEEEEQHEGSESETCLGFEGEGAGAGKGAAGLRAVAVAVATGTGFREEDATAA